MTGSTPDDTALAFSPDWNRHSRLIDPITFALRFDLPKEGRTRDAIQLIHRVLKHPRMAQLVFTNPVTGKLAMALAKADGDAGPDEIIDAIHLFAPQMGDYGQYVAELTLHQLGDAGALERSQEIARRVLCRLESERGSK